VECTKAKPGNEDLKAESLGWNAVWMRSIRLSGSVLPGMPNMHVL
jgi:hypothetical protein